MKPGGNLSIHGQAVRLYGDHFVANIALPEEVGGVKCLARDPRKFRLKPDAYVAVVEKTGPRCRLVKTGDKIVIERWTWDQYDLDEERLIARERDVLITADNHAAPGAIAMKIMNGLKKPATTLYVPETYRQEAPKVIQGQVLTSGHPVAKPGEVLWVEKQDWGQFVTPDGILVFRVNKDAILMRAETGEMEKNSGN